MQHGNNTSFLFLVIFQNGGGTGLDSAQDELVDSKSQKCYDLLVKKRHKYSLQRQRASRCFKYAVQIAHLAYCDYFPQINE